METKGELDIHGPQLTLVTLTAKETEDNLAQGRGSVDPWLDSNRSRGAQRWFVDIWWKGEKETWSKSLVFINLFWVLPCLAMAAWVNPCCIVSHFLCLTTSECIASVLKDWFNPLFKAILYIQCHGSGKLWVDSKQSEGDLEESGGAGSEPYTTYFPFAEVLSWRWWPVEKLKITDSRGDL